MISRILRALATRRAKAKLTRDVEQRRKLQGEPYAVRRAAAQRGMKRGRG